MGKKFVHIYLLKNDPFKIVATAPEHKAYWESLKLSNYQGGPYSDNIGTGGQHLIHVHIGGRSRTGLE